MRYWIYDKIILINFQLNFYNIYNILGPPLVNNAIELDRIDQVGGIVRLLIMTRSGQLLLL